MTRISRMAHQRFFVAPSAISVSSAAGFLLHRAVRLAGTWAELRPVRFFSEVCAGDELVGQVLRIVDDRRDGEPFGPIVRMPIEVFGQDRILAVGHAILAQVSRPHVRCDDFQRAALRWTCRPQVWTAAATAATLRPALPGCNRISLPGRLTGGWLPFAAMEKTRLRSGAPFNLLRDRVLLCRR